MSELDIVRDQSALLVDWAEASVDSVRANTAREGILVAAFALAARVETLTAELAQRGDVINFELDRREVLRERLDEAEARVEALENALEWYADPDNYRPVAPPETDADLPAWLSAMDSLDERGRGSRARAALASRPAGEETQG